MLNLTSWYWRAIRGRARPGFLQRSYNKITNKITNKINNKITNKITIGLAQGQHTPPFGVFNSQNKLGRD